MENTKQPHPTIVKIQNGQLSPNMFFKAFKKEMEILKDTERELLTDAVEILHQDIADEETLIDCESIVRGFFIKIFITNRKEFMND